MFGLKLKPKAEVNLKEAGYRLASAGIRIRLTNELSAMMGALLEDATITDQEAQMRLQNCMDLQEGVDAVLDRELAPFSFSVPDKGQIRAGALIAHGARNQVMLTGAFDFDAAKSALHAAMARPRAS